MSNTEKWGWAHQFGEDFFGADTEADAHTSARQFANEFHDPGTEYKYQVARYVHPLDLIDTRCMRRAIECVVEAISEIAYDECGGDESPIVLASQEKQDELAKIFREFLVKNATINRYGVTGVTQHTYVVPAQEGGAA